MDIILVLGTFSTMLLGFFGIAKIMLSQASKDRESDRIDRRELTKAVNNMAASTKLVAAATTKAAQEAEKRNGHLGEQNVHIIEQGVKIVELIAHRSDDMAEVKKNTERTASILSKSALIAAEDRDILTGGHQIVHEQHVDKQIIVDQSKE